MTFPCQLLIVALAALAAKELFGKMPFYHFAWASHSLTAPVKDHCPPPPILGILVMYQKECNVINISQHTQRM